MIVRCGAAVETLPMDTAASCRTQSGDCMSPLLAAPKSINLRVARARSARVDNAAGQTGAPCKTCCGLLPSARVWRWSHCGILFIAAVINVIGDEG